jgi:hypothetical protein
VAQWIDWDTVASGKVHAHVPPLTVQKAGEQAVGSSIGTSNDNATSTLRQLGIRRWAIRVSDSALSENAIGLTLRSPADILKRPRQRW